MGWIKKSIRKLGLHYWRRFEIAASNPIYKCRIHTDTGTVCMLAHGFNYFYIRVVSMHCR